LLVRVCPTSVQGMQDTEIQEGTDNMKLLDAQIKMQALMLKHGLTDYKFEFDTSVSRFGCCKWETKTLTLSTKLTELNDEAQVTDVMLHEIAHALTPGCWHNEVWQRVAVAIGANGHRCYDDQTTVQPLHKWTATCPKCGHGSQRHKKYKTMFCGRCYKLTHRLSKAIKLKWRKNI